MNPITTSPPLSSSCPSTHHHHHHSSGSDISFEMKPLAAIPLSSSSSPLFSTTGKGVSMFMESKGSSFGENFSFLPPSSSPLMEFEAFLTKKPSFSSSAIIESKGSSSLEKFSQIGGDSVAVAVGYKGFRKVDAERWEFANEDFLRGKRHLLKNIHRRKAIQGQQIGSYTDSPGDTRRTGMDGELEKLKNDRTILMQELVRLQQEHRGSASQIETMKQRMEAAEQRQKQMISFFAKVLQNPVFLTRLQKMNEQKKIATPREKRKFVKHHQADHICSDSTLEGLIVKYKSGGDNIVLSSAMENLNPTPGSQLSDNARQDMVGKTGLGAKVVNDQDNMLTDELEQELVPVSDLMETGGSSLGSLGYGDSFQGKNVVSPQLQVSTDCYVSFPEDLAKEKTFPDIMSLGVESIAKQEGAWDVDFDVTAGFDTSSVDIWSSLSNYEEQELIGGLSDLWDMGSQQAAEDFGVGNWQDNDSSPENFANRAEQSKDNRYKNAGS